VAAERDPLLVHFGFRVRRARERRGLTQEALGEAAGLHRTYVGSVERGERNVSLVNLYAIAGALGVPLPELLPAFEPKRP
jgi:transcriptional regulator with XRE-family HTH domain